MSTEDATPDTNGALLPDKDNTDDDVTKDNGDAAKTDDEKQRAENTETLTEEQEGNTSPFPEYTPPGSQVSLKTGDQTGDQNNTEEQGVLNADANDGGKESKEKRDDNTEYTILPAVTMSQTETQAEPDTKKAEESSESTNQESEPKTEETSQSNDAEQPKEAEKTDEVTENKDVETKDEEKKEEKDEGKKTDDNTDGSKKEEAVVAAAGGAMATEEMEKKIKENEDLQNKLESALSNQEAQREAYQKLVDENAKLQKHHDDMKAKFEEMEGGHVLLAAELETFKKVNEEQRETIAKQQNEIKILKETQGGDENVKDLQEKLIRLSNEQEDKDKRIHSLEGELDATKEKLKDAESRASRNGNAQADAPKSKTCIVM